MLDEVETEEPQQQLIPRRQTRITPGRFKQADYVRSVWQVEMESGHTEEDILNPQYWSMIASQLRVGDRIEVMNEDMSYLGDLVVVRSFPTEAYVKVLFKIHVSDQELDKYEEKEEKGIEEHYSIRFTSGKNKWRVMHRESKKILKAGFQDRELARNWLKDYLKASRN